MQAAFLHASKLPYEAASAEELAPFDAQLRQQLVHNGVRKPESQETLDGIDFYRVPFEQVQPPRCCCCC